MRLTELHRILLENYSLCELEDRLDLTLEDMKEGLMPYIENNEYRVDQMLREDLFL